MTFKPLMRTSGYSVPGRCLSEKKRGLGIDGGNMIGYQASELTGAIVEGISIVG